MNRARRYAIIFVCQQGRLEAQACLLAASLKRFCKLDAQFFAAIPGPACQWGIPAPAVMSFLDLLGVRTVSVTNQIDGTYAIGNKIGCLSIRFDADKTILLDSDMLLMRAWEDEDRFGFAFNARPAAAASFSACDADWDAVYAACQTQSLPGKIRTTYTRQIIAPYFNSAFVAVPTNAAFGDVWLQCCRAIDAAPGIPSKRPYLDQIALSPTIARLKLDYDCLEDSYNYPINFKPIDAGNPPLICHYHDPQTLGREPAAVALARDLAREHPALKSILLNDPIGGVLDLDDRQPVRRKSTQTPELVITGIPRSGTSFLCNCLHRFEHCVVLNEPDEIGPALESATYPWPVAAFYRDRRRDCILRLPIRNKLVDGQVTEDTIASNAQVSYVPEVGRDDFVLGVKTTIPFLSRLEHLRRVMPRARFVACVRNPFDTIASWKTTFAHLRDGAVETTRIGNPRDPWLSGMQRAALQQVAAIENVEIRRAAWWTNLAELILSQREWLVIVTYDELTRDPEGVSRRIIGDWPAGAMRSAPTSSGPRAKKEALDPEDVVAIRSLCSEAARQLGVWRETV